MSVFADIPQTPRPVIYIGHLKRSDPTERPELDRFKRIILVRDPRGYAASMLSFLRMAPSSEYTYAEVNRTFPTDMALIKAIILGYSTSRGDLIPGIRSMYVERALNWSGPNSLVVRYEDLVDSSKRPNRRTLAMIADFIGYPDILPGLIAGSDRRLSATFTTSPVENWYHMEPLMKDVISAVPEIFERFEYRI